MGTLSAELLNGTLIDSNRLIHMISTLGPINDLQKLRQKHLTASYNDQKQLKYVEPLIFHSIIKQLFSLSECYIRVPNLMNLEWL